jgi:hypothetical protein
MGFGVRRERRLADGCERVLAEVAIRRLPHDALRSNEAGAVDPDPHDDPSETVRRDGSALASRHRPGPRRQSACESGRERQRGDDLELYIHILVDFDLLDGVAILRGLKLRELLRNVFIVFKEAERVRRRAPFDRLGVTKSVSP